MIRDSKVDRVKEIADGSNGKWLIKAKNYYGMSYNLIFLFSQTSVANLAI